MAKSPDKPAEQAEGVTPSDQPQQQPQQQQQRIQVQVDDSKAFAGYANFCRVTGTPEELIVDFGLNDQPMGAPHDAIIVTQRIIVNYYTAKRLLAALSTSVQRHERAFGVLETDVQKRIQPGALRQS